MSPLDGHLGRRAIPRRTFLAAGALAFAAACAGSDDDPSSTASNSTTVPPPTTPQSTSAPTPPSSSAEAAKFLDHGSNAKSRVALTFHLNGDPGLAQQLLDVLAAHETVITAFIVGNWLDQNPSWGKKLVDAGHEVANHTYTHPSFLSLSRDGMLDEVLRCRDALTRHAGTPGTLFRPSGTDDGTVAPPAVVQEVSGEAGYPVVLGFDVDPYDYDDPGADAVVQRTLAGAAAGTIISLHFGHTGTVAAMPAILDGLAQRDLTTVTASDLLAPARGAAR
jgi:peptidoglycan/xylan/chitin deacetylase (PgdA/CDA1 family)